MPRSPVDKVKGWTHQTGDRYLVTGTKDGKKVSQEFSEWQGAQPVVLDKGTKWLIRGGKKFVIMRITSP